MAKRDEIWIQRREEGRKAEDPTAGLSPNSGEILKDLWSTKLPVTYDPNKWQRIFCEPTKSGRQRAGNLDKDLEKTLQSLKNCGWKTDHGESAKRWIEPGKQHVLPKPGFLSCLQMKDQCQCSLRIDKNMWSGRVQPCS